MGTKLEEVDPEGSSLDSILITLPCKHAFTVETLDGICDLKAYYEQKEDRWIRPILPPPGSVKSPMCPQCRGEVVSHRYGRVLKRCNLDLLERTVATSTMKRLQGCLQRQQGLNLSATKMTISQLAPLHQKPIVDAAGLLEITSKYEDVKRRMNQNSDRPFSEIHFWGFCLTADYRIHSDYAAILNQIGDLRLLYRDAYQIVTTVSSHRIAYEHSLSRVYRLELGKMPSDIDSLRKRQQEALETAKVTIGMTPPLADRRFQVEGIWLTVELRMTLASLVREFQEKVSKQEKESTSVLSRLWGLVANTPNQEGQAKVLELFVQFIYETCTLDTKLALGIAQKTGAYRQILKSELKLLRISLEEFNFKAQLPSVTPVQTQSRKELAALAKEGLTQANKAINRARTTYFQQKDDSEEERQWVEENFMQTAKDVLKSWAKAEKSFASDVFYQPMSVEEKKQIQQAFNFTHRGHWYICPNGHTFVITECGGAMQVGRCNECGAQIGGMSHQLLGSNARARDFEAIANAQGVERSPWGWAADA